jgi:hypothetical protein
MVNTYSVKVVREAGSNPITGKMVPYGEEEMTIDATSKQKAHEIAYLLFTLEFRGQPMRVFIDGEEHFDERH